MFTLIASIVFAIVLDTLWVAFFRAQPVGKFKILRDGESVFQYQSHNGVITIFPKEGKFQYKDMKGSQSIKCEDLKGIEYRANESLAVIQDLFSGVQGIDLQPQYMDTIDWFSLTAVAKDGKRIPLYLSGQYNPRGFMLSWYIDLQAQFLEKIGVLVDVEQKSFEIMELVCEKLGNPKLL